MKDLKKKRILITGATGFIGANLTRCLVGEGCRNIHILTRKTSDRWRIRDIHRRVHDHHVDIRDYARLRKVVLKIKPQAVFHCAVYGGYPHQKSIREIFETNVNGTLNLIRSLSDISYESFLNTGSSSEYGIKTGPMREDDAPCPIDIYGASKASATIFAETAAIAGKKPITTVRPFSIYGPYEAWTRLIPSVVEAAILDKELAIRSPSSVRDFIYIDDVIDFFLEVASRRRSLGVLNIGSGRQHSVRDVVRIASSLRGSRMKVKWARGDKSKMEPRPWMADMTKARRLIKWRQKTNLREGLRKTIEWTKRYHKGFA